MRNWAGNVEFTSHEVARPTTIDELRRIVAGAPGRRLHAIGSRHSFNRVADGRDLLVDVSAIDTPIEVDGELAWCGAGVRYGELTEVLDRKGRALHNLPSLPHVTVGGAVATATHGSGAANPALSAAVVAVELVTATGDLAAIDARSGGDDLAGCVVALGALGVVTRLALRTEPSFEVAQTVYESLPVATATAHLDELMSMAYSVSLFTDWRDDTIDQVWVKRRTGTREGVLPSWFGATPALAERHPLPGVAADACTSQIGRAGPWHTRLPHFRLDHTPSHGDELQTEYFVPFEHGPDAMTAMTALGDRLAPLLLVSEVRAVAADEHWLSPMSRGPQLAIHLTWRNDPAGVAALLPEIEAALDAWRPLPHWGKLSAMPASTIGARLRGVERFGQLAHRLDPDGTFRNDVVDRLLEGGDERPLLGTDVGSRS